jgi:hypothetical protein
MHVGVLKVRLHIPASRSLKDKRQVVNSIVARTRNSYNVSISEIDGQGVWQSVTLGIACTSGQVSYVSELLQKVLDSIVHARFDAEVVDHDMEILSVL